MEQKNGSENPNKKNFFDYLLSNSYYLRNRTFSDLLKDILILLAVATLMVVLIMLNFNVKEN